MNLFCNIKRLFVQVLSRIVMGKDRLMWTFSLPFTPKPAMLGKVTFNEGLSVIIAPHADDELLGCFAYIKKHPNTVILYCGLLGSNYGEKNAAIREKEFISFCEGKGINYKLLHDNLKEEIKSSIECLRPSSILIPSFVDWHKEHRLMSIVLLDVVDSLHDSTIIWYRVSVPIMLYNYSVEESRRGFINKWKCFLHHYSSQKSINYKRFQFIEKHCVSNVYAAELFYIQTKNDFVNNMELLLPQVHILDSLKHVLNNYKALSRNTCRIYNILLESQSFSNS